MVLVYDNVTIVKLNKRMQITEKSDSIQHFIKVREFEFENIQHSHSHIKHTVPEISGTKATYYNTQLHLAGS